MQLENQIKELKELNDEAEYQLEKSKDKVFKLERHLSDTLTKLNTQSAITNTTHSCRSDGVNTNNHSAKLTNLTEEQVCKNNYFEVLIIFLFIS
jgi:hypothetical protein